jgi:hypothetical protein
MAPGVARITAGFRFREFAFRAFESVLLRAIGGRRSASQFHPRSAHGAARRPDLEGWGRRDIRRRHGFSGDTMLTFIATALGKG